MKIKISERIKRQAAEFVTGNIFSKKEFQSRMPYVIFLSILTILYIFNGFYINGLHSNSIKLSNQVKELRAKSMTLKSIRMSSTRQSYLIKQIEERGLTLEESLTPPKVID